MRWVRKIDDFASFIGYVVVCAPAKFPREDFLKDDEQMNLDRAFAELRHGVTLVEADFPGADAKRGLNALLDRAFDAYRRNETVAAAHLLQDFRALIFKE